MLVPKVNRATRAETVFFLIENKAAPTATAFLVGSLTDTNAQAEFPKVSLSFRAK